MAFSSLAKLTRAPYICIGSLGVANPPCRVMIPTNGSADTLRSICSYGDVGVLYLGGSQLMVRPRVCRGMRSWIRLWISSRGLAIRPAGSDLVPYSSGAVAAQKMQCSADAVRN